SRSNRPAWRSVTRLHARVGSIRSPAKPATKLGVATRLMNTPIAALNAPDAALCSMALQDTCSVSAHELQKNCHLAATWRLHALLYSWMNCLHYHQQDNYEVEGSPTFSGPQKMLLKASWQIERFAGMAL